MATRLAPSRHGEALLNRPLPIIHNPEGFPGARFVATEAAVSKQSPFDGWKPEELRTWVAALWRDAFEAKRPETARLQRNSDYYDGFHYQDAWQNRVNTVENECWRVVEVQVANTIASRPRPEIRPKQDIPEETVKKLQKYATNIEDTSHYDWAILLGARDKRIYGWNPWLISLDYRTGMPYPKPLSVFDFYRDPAGRNDFECGYWILAQCVPTARLRATYPNVAQYIKPDNIASPAYETSVRRWYNFLEHGAIDTPQIADGALVVHSEGAPATEATVLVQSTGDHMEYGSSSFLLQVLVRDEVMVDCDYLGDLHHANGEMTPGMKFKGKVPRSPSGLWLVTMTAGGVFCEDPKPLDTCFDGLPFVVDRVAQRTDRYESMADLDHVIPIQRNINRMNALFDRSIELSANPPVLADRMSGLRAQLNGGTVDGGEVLDIARGSDVRFLEYRGPDQRYFERLGERRKVIQDIAGTPESLEGSRPAGIEAASAIRQLDQNSQRRLQGGENAAHQARGELLRKLMFCTGAKAQPEINFFLSDGSPEVIRAQHLLLNYAVSFAPGTGTVEGRRDLEDKAVALFDRGALDVQALLETFEYPGATEIAARIQQQQLLQQAVAASQGGGAQPSGNGGGKKSGSTVGAARG